MADEKPKVKISRKKRLAVESGIYPNFDSEGKPDNTFDVKISRRMWMSDSNPHGQKVKRARNVEGLVSAKRKKKEFLDELAMEAMKHEGQDVKWRVALNTYYEYLERRHKENTLSLTTMETTIGTLERHTHQWSKKWLSEFKTAMIEDFIFSTELKAQVAVATRFTLLKYIRGVFYRQVALGRISHNPVVGIVIKKGDQNKGHATMTHAQMVAVIKYAEGANPDWAYIYKLAYLTGARSGELYSLRFSDYLTNGNKRLEISRSYCWKSEKEKSTKSGQTRTVPVNKDLASVLAELKLKNPNSEYILPRLKDWKNGKSAQILRGYQQAIGMPPEQRTNFHAIRATFITNLLLAGQPPIMVQQIVGHRDLKTLLGYVANLGNVVNGATDALTLESNIHDISTYKDKKPNSK